MMRSAAALTPIAANVVIWVQAAAAVFTAVVVRVAFLAIGAGRPLDVASATRAARVRVVVRDAEPLDAEPDDTWRCRGSEGVTGKARWLRAAVRHSSPSRSG
jgi:hypothetical protein